MPIGTTAALLGSAAISGGTSILGGLFGKSAAQKAAESEKAAAAAAAAKATATANDANWNIAQAAKGAGENVVDTANTAADDVKRAALAANDKLADYSDAGATASQYLSSQLKEGGVFNKTPTLADIQIDPSYDFTKSEQLKAINASAASKGGGLGGGVLKALEDRAYSLSSQEYSKAYDRFRQNTQDRFTNLSSVADRGATASNTQGQNLISAGEYGGTAKINAAGYEGDAVRDAAIRSGANSIDATRSANGYNTDGATAEAAGKVAAGNALWGGINGASSTVSTAVQIAALLKNPGLNLINPRTGIKQ